MSPRGNSETTSSQTVPGWEMLKTSRALVSVPLETSDAENFCQLVVRPLNDVCA